MAERDSNTIIEGAGQESQPGSGFPLCEECGEIARFGEKLCPVCQRARRQEAARQELVEEKTHPEDLDVLLDKATLGLNSMCTLLDTTEEYDEVSQVLIPLVERLRADLEKIEAVIAGSLGKVRVLVCTDYMRIGDKSYGEGDFFQAVLEPTKAPTSVQEAQ